MKNLISRTILGVLSATAVCLLSSLVLLRLVFKLSLEGMRIYDFILGLAISAFFIVAALICPAAIILFVLDQISYSFRLSGYRPLYAGIITGSLPLAWALCLGEPLEMLHPMILTAFGVVFLSGAVFGSIVRFHPLESTEQDAAANP